MLLLMHIATPEIMEHSALTLCAAIQLPYTSVSDAPDWLNGKTDLIFPPARHRLADLSLNDCI